MQRVYTLVRNRRKQMGLTQKQMSKKLGVCLKTYVSIETGKMSLEHLNDICNILDLTVLVLPKELVG